MAQKPKLTFINDIQVILVYQSHNVRWNFHSHQGSEAGDVTKNFRFIRYHQNGRIRGSYQPVFLICIISSEGPVDC